MKKILAESIEFIYENDFENFVIEDLNDAIITNDATKFIDKHELSRVCRISITPDKIRKKKWIEYLYWFDNTKLNEVDEKIEKGLYSDNDFTNSIKTNFVKNLSCPNCKKVYRGGLVVDPAVFYIGEFNLAKEKLQKIRESKKVKLCPNCLSSFRIIVVFIFEDKV